MLIDKSWMASKIITSRLEQKLTCLRWVTWATLRTPIFSTLLKGRKTAYPSLTNEEGLAWMWARRRSTSRRNSWSIKRKASIIIRLRIQWISICMFRNLKFSKNARKWWTQIKTFCRRTRLFIWHRKLLRLTQWKWSWNLKETLQNKMLTYWEQLIKLKIRRNHRL